MTPAAAQSLAAALAAFIAVTPLAGSDPKSPAHERHARRASVTGLSGIGMPDTGPGNVPLQPLTVIVNVDPTARTSARGEIAQLGTWLSTHHSRARMVVVSGHQTTGIVEPSTIAQAPLTRPIQSPSTFTRETLARRPGQRLLIIIGSPQTARPSGAATLRLPFHDGAPIVDDVPLRARQVVEQPVDPRRPGVVAATAARAVISLAHLREVRP